MLNTLLKFENSYINFITFEIEKLNVLIIFFNYTLIIIHYFIIFLIEMLIKFK